MRKHVLKTPFAVGALAALALMSGSAFAQLSGLARPNPVSNAVTLGPALLQAHKADLEAIAGDLVRVQTPAAAKEYEAYLEAQLPKYVQNHKALHHVAVPEFRRVRTSLGNAGNSQQAIADATDKLSETHFPRIAAEMERVEKLNPALKKKFDVLRTLD
jgi:hypothetical protein